MLRLSGSTSSFPFSIWKYVKVTTKFLLKVCSEMFFGGFLHIVYNLGKHQLSEFISQAVECHNIW